MAMETDYGAFLFTGCGRIWWRLEDAIRLGAGYRPVRDEGGNPSPRLRALDQGARSNERSLIGAFHDVRLGIPRPSVLERDGEHFVEAGEFLSWLGQYLARTQTPIAYPSELALAVREAKASGDRDTDSEPAYSSLEAALEAWFDKQLDDLPEDLRGRVEREFLPLPWQKLNADQRRSAAQQSDYWRDPAIASEREFWSELSIRKGDIERQIREWTDVGSPTATDLAQKQAQLAQLRSQLKKLEQAERRGLADHSSRSARALEIDQMNDSSAQGPSQTICDVTRIRIQPRQPDRSTVRDGSMPDQSSAVSACDVFRCMKGLDASELSLTFVGDKGDAGLAANNMLEINARGTTKRVPLAALDLVDRRRGTLNSLAAILVGMAAGELAIRNDKTARHMSRLRKVFREHFGVVSDPFEPYRPGSGWLPRFKIADNRGAADRRAEQEAARRMVSLRDDRHAHLSDSTGSDEDTLDCGQDLADDWLSRNDPDCPS